MKPHDNLQPPRWATWLLKNTVSRDTLEEVHGDLLEEFEYRRSSFSLRNARLDYIRSVLGFSNPFNRKRKSSTTSNSISMNMLGHYMLVAWRNIIRQRSFAVINIAGLALGMTCCLLIYLWVQDERQVDGFHENGKSLYTVYTTTKAGDVVSGSYTTPIVFGTLAGSGDQFYLADDLKKSIPEIQYAVSYQAAYDLPWGHPETFQIHDKVFKLEGSRASADFFKMFSFPLIAGDRATALNGPAALTISRKMSDLFFATPQEAIGKSIRIENAQDLVVTGVFEDISVHSSFHFDYLLSWEALRQKKLDFSSNNSQTFVQLAEHSNAILANEKISHFLDGVTLKNGGFALTMGLMSYGDMYLHSNFTNGQPDGGRIGYVQVFSGVALFVLLMACINFMNLATARSVKRAREVGVRKVVGSRRIHLILQFFGESVLLAVLALILSVALTALLLPWFNDFTGKQISVPYQSLSAWMMVGGLLLVTGLIAGSYPALFMSSLKPARILKGMVKFSNSSVYLRKGLAVFQFSLSIMLLIATIVVTRQMDFIQHSNLGFDRENLIYLRVEGELIPKYNVFKTKAEAMPGIARVDRSSEAPHDMNFTVADAISWEGKPKDASVGFKPSSVGFDFIPLMNIQVVDGRGFSRAFPSDTAAFIVNEEALKQMGMKDPIGKWISAWDKKGTIIGVVKDYHTNSLREPIRPVIIDVKEDLYFGVILVRTQPGKTTDAIASLEKIYKEINPNYPLTWQFLDVEYARLYRTEQMMTELSNAFAVVAIMISCLGLLGLVMFSAEQRVKEIGIRKVLGASVSGIVGLLSRDFVVLVGSAFVIAAPVAAWYMNEWLRQFNYKVELSWWIFAVAGLATLFVALLTISIQAIQSAAANPVRSLRSE